MKLPGTVSCILLAVGVSVAVSAGAAVTRKAPAKRATLTNGALTVDIVDLSPQFLAWYASARAAPDADARFKLWQSLYGFAAVPPTPGGAAMARRLVDAAWPHYAEAVAPARAGAAAMKPEPVGILRKVAQMLGVTEREHIQLIAYIGAFENNAFSYRGRYPTVAIPLESTAEARTLSLAHEGTHAVHMDIAKLSGGWERSVAATMLQEGLAMHVAREVVPGLPVQRYVGAAPGWWDASRVKERTILQDLKSKLTRSDSAAVSGVTIDIAPASGLNREAYYGGWRVVEQMRKDGLSLADVARIPEGEMPARVGQALNELLGAPR